MTIVEEKPASSGTADNSIVARKAMIDSQLRTSGVNAEYVLARMASVPREDFVPAAARALAYRDRAIPLADGKCLAAPVVHGLMLQEAAPSLQDKTLLVDGGSGYLAELLRPLVGSLEVVSPEEAIAETRKRGDFTLLIVDGAVEQLPDGLTRRLADNGRVVTGLVIRSLTRLSTGRKVAGNVSLVPLAEIGMPILPQFAVPKGWSF